MAEQGRVTGLDRFTVASQMSGLSNAMGAAFTSNPSREPQVGVTQGGVKHAPSTADGCAQVATPTCVRLPTWNRSNQKQFMSSNRTTQAGWRGVEALRGPAGQRSGRR